MTRAIVYDRCIDAAGVTCARLRRSRISAVAVHPTDFDRTFDAEGMPHVLVTELDMPLFSGFELIRQVRADWSSAELPIVAYTTSDDAQAWAAARAAGADEVVAKAGPDAIKRLEAAIARCLGRFDAPPPAMVLSPVRLWSRWVSRGQMAMAA